MIYLKLYQALLTSIAVHKTPGDVYATSVTPIVLDIEKLMSFRK